MSLEFSQELDTPIISPTFAPQDAGEIGLRPKLLSDYTGQEKAKGIHFYNNERIQLKTKLTPLEKRSQYVGACKNFCVNKILLMVK